MKTPSKNVQNRCAHGLLAAALVYALVFTAVITRAADPSTSPGAGPLPSKFELRDGTPVLVRMSELNFLDDKGGKPIGINQHIGRRPILALGNSDGDLQMLQWTAAGGAARFMGLVHHTDAAREWAYDRTSAVGRLDKALDEAQAKGWTVVDMKIDWKRIFASE
jgi:hypothetical protein